MPPAVPLLLAESYGWNFSYAVMAALMGIGVLVVDSADKWWDLRGDAENSSGSTIEAIQPLADAAAEGLAVLLSTHQRKSGGEHGEAAHRQQSMAERDAAREAGSRHVQGA